MRLLAGKDDIAFSQKIASGDARAFEEFYDRFATRLFSIAFRLCGDAGLSEDMTQEVFLHLLRKIHLFNGQASLSTWLYRVATNFYISYLRSYRPKQYPHESEESLHKHLDQKSSQQSSTLHHRLDLERCLAQLPDGYRTIIVLHDIEGYKHEEIAEMLNISPGTSKSQLHHARMKLRSLLQGVEP
ncbi:MAG: RNA polymerase sigma factor [Acidobacteria bacterium]|nr:RNA polymerase sigma factor [Acidobacteriota bacterium]